ncbi:MAG: hypothetical protein K6F37_08325 [Lachnospiraceae bacterium]|nr:hypothetical protein [Lachnospiraceae bacterium]
MENYREKLQKQLGELDSLIEVANKRLKKANTSENLSFVVSKSHGCDQYYFYNRENKKRIYVKEKNVDSLRKIAQRDYDKAIIRKLNSMRSSLSGFIDKYNPNEIDEIYLRMADARKKLVIPIIEPDDLFVKKWKKVQYDPMPYSEEVKLISDKGVRVRSKSELIIANQLERLGIPYRYEYPLGLNGRTVRPDFICLNIRTRQEFVWEHFGMMDNIAYANKNVAKIQEYESAGYYSGINMIMTFETSQNPLSSDYVKRTIETYLC